MKKTRNTLARTTILELINQSDIALSHAEIQSKVGDLCDRVTIYRVLDRLLAEDLVHKIVNLEGIVKYAKCHNCDEVHHHDHLHFSCQKCLEVTCLEQVIPVYKLPAHYQVTEMSFTLAGLCPACAD